MISGVSGDSGGDQDTRWPMVLCGGRRYRRWPKIPAAEDTDGGRRYQWWPKIPVVTDDSFDNHWYLRQPMIAVTSTMTVLANDTCVRQWYLWWPRIRVTANDSGGGQRYLLRRMIPVTTKGQISSRVVGCLHARLILVKASGATKHLATFVTSISHRRLWHKKGQRSGSNSQKNTETRSCS